MLSKLRGLRSPVCAMLEGRITLVEKCQILMFKKVKQIPRAELALMVSEVQESAMCVLPLGILLDLLERGCDDKLTDYFTETLDANAMQTSANKFVEAFSWWGDAEDDIDLLKLTSRHVLASHTAQMENKVHEGKLSREEFIEENKKAEQVHFFGQSEGLANTTMFPLVLAV